MAHDFSIPGCTIYIWNPKGVLKGTVGSWWGSEGARVGHTAIRVGNGTENIYLSFWPEHSPKSSGFNSYVRGYMANNKMPATQLNTATEWARQQNVQLDGDEDHEGTKPDIKFRFTQGLDWDAMIAKAKKLKTETGAYKLLSKNCTQAVAEVLDSGNPPVKVPLTGWLTNLWQPGDMTNYCKTLKDALNNTVAGSATQKVGTGWQ